LKEKKREKTKRLERERKSSKREGTYCFVFSISGHYSFHVFYGLTMIYTIVSLKRTPSQLFNYVNRKLLTRFLSRKLRYISWSNLQDHIKTNQLFLVSIPTNTILSVKMTKRNF
jgi:hypothetical protein